VVNTSSGNGGISPLPGTPIDAASKSAVTVISECLYGRFRMLPASERIDASIRARAQSMLERSQPDSMVEKRPPAAGGLSQD